MVEEEVLVPKDTLRGPLEKLPAAEARITSKLEGAMKKYVIEALPKNMSADLEKKIHHIAKKNEVECCFEKKQKRRVLNIEGVFSKVQAAVSAIQEEIFTFTVNSESSDGEVALPPEWQKQSKRTTELFPVVQGSAEWQQVEGKFASTMGGGKVRSIDRIQNSWIWKKYVFQKKRMEMKNNGRINEMELFHGTRGNNPLSIYEGEDGFDMQFCQSGMWGLANYFAVNASYSHNYSYTSGNGRQMFLVKVLTGDTYYCPSDSSFRMPPVKPSTIQGGVERAQMKYDTVSGTTNGSQVFMTYDNDKAYPAYLITYNNNFESDGKVALPPEWQKQSKRTTELFPIVQGSAEWQQVEGKFASTMGGGKVRSIDRIQNSWIWKKYVFQKKRMEMKNNGRINEMELFHGTRGNNPSSIYEGEDGFDMQFCQSGMWGLANYFAVNASYSHNYSYTSGNGRQMFLVKVLTGDTYYCPSDSSFRMPPVKPSTIQGGVERAQMKYDTVSGTTNGSQVFMTYDNDKAYPAYLITYNNNFESDGKVALPPEWQKQSKTTELFPVVQGSAEWQQVEGKFASTMGGGKVRSIDRIQNSWIWKKYVFQKKRMEMKNNGRINEMELFHGTRGNNPSSIYEGEDGFDMQFCQSGMWGLANYFAVNASYSHNYSYTSGNGRQMFLVKVLTGDTYYCPSDSSFRMPPVKPSTIQGGVERAQMKYDTVSGTTNGSQVFMTYDNDKAYPAYLITYNNNFESDGKVALPPEWQKQSKTTELFPVVQGSAEWQQVEGKFASTMGGGKVRSIDRIQNSWIWKKYVFQKKRMEMKNSGRINEMELFHGTRGNNPSNIYEGEDGFDMRFCRSGMWGLANYFAVNASYSHNYSYTSGNGQQMFLVKVLTGDTYYCPSDSSFRMPPVKPSTTQGGVERAQMKYDTVSGTTNGSQVFMTYDNDKAYPAYLITYNTNSESDGKVALPPEWQKQSKTTELFPVVQGSAEWQQVEGKFASTMGGGKVRSIDRIQNSWIWYKYVFQKKRMEMKNSGRINEMELFHGTRRNNPSSIYEGEYGFDMRFCQNGMWGLANYFAVNASYSHNYAYTSGNGRQMFLVKVLTGDTYNCPSNTSLRMPPVKPSTTQVGVEMAQMRYDTVSGTTNGSQVFMTYDNDKAYPAYLITYI